MVDDEEHRVVFVDTAEGLVFHCVYNYIRIGESVVVQQEGISYRSEPW